MERATFLLGSVKTTADRSLFLLLLATRAAKHAGVIEQRLCLTLIENIGINLPIDIVERNWRSLHSHRARHQEI